MTPERWQRVEALFEAAVEHPLRERTAFVATAAVGDDELRREVESLLGADASTKGALDSSPIGWQVVDLAPGQRIGTYEIVDVIGAGAMGAVYRARDTVLNREVALKVLPPIFALDARRVARFQREANVLAALNHPNIAGIYSLEASDGVNALALEFVDGATLAERIAAGPLPLADVIHLGGQIAEALEAAHEKGIIHRDLKPANIKITTSGVVKVLD